LRRRQLRFPAIGPGLIARQGAFAILFVAATPLREFGPWAALWTAPCILAASILIAWGAESAQFFVAQGFALAILAWMQTLPEFAVEAVLAWHQQRSLLLANLTGALRLLIGVGWPMIYAIAAGLHRRRAGTALGTIRLDEHHSVEVAGLTLPLIYALVIWWKGTLTLWDAAVLIILYAAYMAVLTKLPPESHEGIDDLEAVPRAIVCAPKHWRLIAIGGCFLVGGVLMRFTAEPFLGSLIAVAATLGLPSFVIIQWLAPVVSEFPELASTSYFARQSGEAPVALMNIASSNINQWTLLVAMLPMVLSLGAGVPSAIAFDAEQQLELLLTIGQSLVALVFLFAMELRWWQALGLFAAFVLQFAFSVFSGSSGAIGYLGTHIKGWIVIVYFGYTAGATLFAVFRWRQPPAVRALVATWRAHVQSA
jgi:cation:H+ antiporter